MEGIFLLRSDEICWIFMVWTKLIELERPRGKTEVAIAGFPGVANVGGQVQSYLRSKLDGKPIARLYSEYLLLPGNVAGILIEPNGEFSLPSVDFNLVTNKKGDSFVLVHSHVQPLPWGQLEIAHECIDYLKRLGVRRIVIVTGFAKSEEVGRVLVFGNDEEIVQRVKEAGGVENREIKTIIGLAGAFLATIKKVGGLSFVSLTGVAEDSSYYDPRASRSVLEILNRVFDLGVDLRDLDEIIEHLEKIRRKVLEELEAQLSKPSEEESPSYVG